MTVRMLGSPPLTVRLLPQNGATTSRLLALLSKTTEQEMGLSFASDESGITLGGQNERQLDQAIGKLRALGAEFSFEPPQISYCATISRQVTQDYTHKRLRGGVAEFARVILEVAPAEFGADNQFIAETPDSSVPNRFLAAIKNGVLSVAASGPLAGVPLTGLIVTLLDGAFHEEDSSPTSFEIAARAAMREAMERAGIAVFEPIMNLTATCPKNALGMMVGNLHRRRGVVTGSRNTDGFAILEAQVPLANLLGYSSDLKHLTRGQGSFSMSYAHHAEVPGLPDYDPENFPPAIGMRA